MRVRSFFWLTWLLGSLSHANSQSCDYNHMFTASINPPFNAQRTQLLILVDEYSDWTSVLRLACLTTSWPSTFVNPHLCMTSRKLGANVCIKIHPQSQTSISKFMQMLRDRKLPYSAYTTLSDVLQSMKLDIESRIVITSNCWDNSWYAMSKYEKTLRAGHVHVDYYANPAYCNRILHPFRTGAILPTEKINTTSFLDFGAKLVTGYDLKLNNGLSYAYVTDSNTVRNGPRRHGRPGFGMAISLAFLKSTLVVTLGYSPVIMYFYIWCKVYRLKKAFLYAIVVNMNLERNEYHQREFEPLLDDDQ